MSKYWWKLSWMRLIISSMGMLAILIVVPVRSLANTSGTKISSVQHPALTNGALPTPDATSKSDNPETTPITTIAEIITPSATTSKSDNPETTPITTVTEILTPSGRSPASQPIIDHTVTEDSDSSMSQLNSVSQLSDVRSSDWAFQALQSLVERYSCIEGYPDKTYRGNRALTRYEFAAGLNACSDKITQLIAGKTANLVTKQDLETLRRLTTEFGPEVAQLRGRVDALETRTAQLQANRFSATTVFRGEVETVIGGILAGNNVVTKTPAPKTITFQDRVRLLLNTSFNGTDQLRATLLAGNIAPVGGTRTGILGTTDGRTSDNASPAFSNNQVYLSGLRYQFLPTKNTQVNIFAQSDGAFEIGLTGPINPYFEGSAANAISRYARRNMVYDYGDTGAGIAILQALGKQFELGLEYTAINGENPTPNNGLFSGRYVALGQLSYFTPHKDFRLALTYANTYSPPNTTGQTGTNFGPVIGSNLANLSVPGTGTVGNLYGIEALYKLSPKFALNGWAGYSAHRYLGRGDGQVWDWGVGLAFPDLFKKANLGGIFVGMEPKLTGLSQSVNLGAGAGIVDKDTSLHIEGFYQYQVNDNIAITPGVIWITAPDFNASNPSSVVGWLRTTFKF